MLFYYYCQSHLFFWRVIIVSGVFFFICICRRSRSNFQFSIFLNYFSVGFDNQSMIQTGPVHETAVAPVRRSIPIQENEIDWMTQVHVSTFLVTFFPFVLYFSVYTK